MMNVIRNIFNDKRDMFEIEEGLFLLDDQSEVVKLRSVFEDLTPGVLADITEECEEIYHSMSTPVLMYVVLDKNSQVTVAEHTIASDAEFTIRVAHLEEDPIAIALRIIEEKIRQGQATNMDLNKLHIIPMMARKEDRKEVRAKASELITMALEN